MIRKELEKLKVGDAVEYDSLIYHVAKISGDLVLIANRKVRMWIKFYELD